MAGSRLSGARMLQLIQAARLMVALTAVAKQQSGNRGAASSAAAAPKNTELTQVETAGAAAVQPTQSGWL